MSGGISTIAGTGIGGYSGDGGAATLSTLYHPSGVAIDTFGNIYIADGGNNRIRKINATTGIINTIAGNGIGAYSGDGGAASFAELNRPCSVCFDKYQNLYITDAGNHRIRKIDTIGNITTIIGNGSSGSTGDGGPALLATCDPLYNMCIDASGNIFFADNGNATIRKVNTLGIISIVCGDSTGHYIYSSDEVPALGAPMSPEGIALDENGLLLITDVLNNRIRRMDTSGIIHTIAGDGIYGSSGDGGNPDSAEIGYPEGITMDHCGNVYISQIDHPCIRKVTFNIDTLAIMISTSSGDTLCSGTAATCSATVTGSTTYAYNWLVNGRVASTASNTYIFTPANGDSVQCVFFGNIPCSGAADTVRSNIIHMVVSSVLPAMHITTSPGDTVCSGTTVSYNSLMSNGGSVPAYQWMVNGVDASGGDASTFAYLPVNGDTVSCRLISNAACAVTDTVSSNKIVMKVNPLLTPSVSITSGLGDTSCAGIAITYTAAVVNGGTTPGLQWKVNGGVRSAAVGFTYAPLNADIISCKLTSDAACAMPVTVASNNIVMVVDSVLVPELHITSYPGDTVCAMAAVNFVAVESYRGHSYTYEWTINGSSTGGSSDSLYSYIPANGDNVQCLLHTGSGNCVSAGIYGSNTVHMVTDNPSAPTINIIARVSGATGSTVILTASVTGTGSGYTIRWYNNDTLFATTTAPVTLYTIAPGVNKITASIITSAPCYDSATSAVHTINAGDEVVACTNSNTIEVYPNPAHNSLTLTGNINNVSISNTIGERLLYKKITGGKTVLDISSLPVGVYLLTVTRSNGEKMIYKIVKE